MTTRGLEPAGVDLQARGFREYINKLQQIEKANRRVFDQQFRGTGLSYSQVTSAAKKYQQQAQQTANTQNQLVQAFATGALIGFGRQLTIAAIEAARAAAAFQGQSLGLQNLAASYGQSASDIRDAMRRASQGVLSESAIIQGANQSLLLNVARTPEQFEEITRTALILGRTLGLSATQSIEQFNIALGRKSLLILDNFGISARAVNQEIERLAQSRFGETARSLSQAQRDSLFLEAALKVAGQAADALGDEVLTSTSGFDRLVAQSENLKVVLGTAILPLVNQFANAIADALVTAQQLTAFISAGAAGLGSILQDVSPAANVGDLFEQFRAGQITFAEFLFGTNEPQEQKDFTQILDDAAAKATEAFKQVARAQGTAFPEDIADKATDSIEENTDALEKNEELLKALKSALGQAEQLELSFARAAEDAARRLKRQQDKLARSQFKDRQKLLNDQAKDFDEFQKDELESVKEAEDKLTKERDKAGKEQKQQQDKLFRELRQAQERFNLDQIQSRRRFDLQDQRLRASGDILALQQLREDFNLQQQEAKENFDLQNKQRKEDGKDQSGQAKENRQERIDELQQELSDLQNGLDKRREEFLAAQEEEFNNLLEKQAEQKLALRESYLEQEEDRRISQQRQLEDLGRSLAMQEDLTAEGAMAISQQIEEAFGVDGVADQIYSGFTARQESKFKDLYANLEEIVATGQKKIQDEVKKSTQAAAANAGFGANPSLLLGQQAQTSSGLHLPIIQKFHQGGIVGGPRGSEQFISALGGETILPTHQMNAPIVPSQNLNVNMSGGFNITGGEGVGARVKEEAISEMTEAFEIAVKRLGRRI